MSDRTIFIVNDDGICSPGIVQLARAAVRFGEVWVVAPETQRSAMSHRITCFDPITVRSHEFACGGVRAFSCSGSPADCVRVGIKVIGRKPDAVLSGINNGYNIGADIQYSATVGAALEAAFWGIHAIAFSQDDPARHEVTDRYLDGLIEEYLDRPLSRSQIWNINFPSCTVGECAGVKRGCTVSTDDYYADDYSESVAEDGSREYRLIMGRKPVFTEGCDLHAVCNNFVSVGVVNNLG